MLQSNNGKSVSNNGYRIMTSLKLLQENSNLKNWNFEFECTENSDEQYKLHIHGGSDHFFIESLNFYCNFVDFMFTLSN